MDARFDVHNPLYSIGRVCLYSNRALVLFWRKMISVVSTTRAPRVAEPAFAFRWTLPGRPSPEVNPGNPLPWWMRLLDLIAGSADSASGFIKNVAPPVYIPPDLRCQLGEKQYCSGRGPR